MRALWLGLLFLSLGLGAQEITLAPADPEPLGGWAQAVQALRLHPLPPSPVRYEGPALSLRLHGEIVLGEARYALVLGVSPQNAVSLWLDLNRDGRLTPEEELPRWPAAEAVRWALTLTAEPADAPAYPYPLQILWPEGRSYVFLVGGAPRLGEFQGRKVVLVDGDLDGVFGTEGDFLAVDVDGDGKIHADPDGHERFRLAEAVTLGDQSFRVAQVARDGSAVRFEPTAYVSPKVPLIPGARAPDFSFRNFSDGQVLSLSQFRGKVVLLDFWATWCPPCLAALPGLRALYEEFHPQGFEIVGVSLDENGEDLRRVLATYAIPWPNAFFGRRWENPVANLYRVYQVPTTYLLDRHGVIRHRDLHGTELRAAVRALLAEGGAEEPARGPAAAGLILEVPGEVRLLPGAPTQVNLEIRNASGVGVEEVLLSWEGLPPGLQASRPPPVRLAPHEHLRLTLLLHGEGLDPQAFPRDVGLVVRYRYANGAEGVQRAWFRLALEEAQSRRGLPAWVWGALVLGLLLVLVLARGTFFLLPLLFLLPGGPFPGS